MSGPSPYLRRDGGADRRASLSQMIPQSLAHRSRDRDCIGRIGVNANGIGPHCDVFAAEAANSALAHRAKAARSGFRGVFCIVLARYDQRAVVGIVEIRVKFRDELMAALRID